MLFLQVGGDIEAVRVVEHPDAGPLRDRDALVGFLLYEPFRRRHLVVHRIVEHSVHGEWLGEPEGPERHPAVGAAADRFARRRGGRTQDPARHRGVEGSLLAGGEAAGAAAWDSQVVLAVLEPAVLRPGNRSVRSGGRGGEQRAGGQQQGAGCGKTPHRKGGWQTAEQGDFLPNQW